MGRAVSFVSGLPRLPRVGVVLWCAASGRPPADLGSENHSGGRSVYRVNTTASQWVAIVNRAGSFQFLPPLLSGRPYYLSQPQHRFVAVVDRYHEGAQRLQVDGIGEVSVVNISTGHLGVCRRQACSMLHVAVLHVASRRVPVDGRACTVS